MNSRAALCVRLCSALRTLVDDHTLRRRALDALVADGGIDLSMAAWALESSVARFDPPRLEWASRRADALVGAHSLAEHPTALVLAESVPTAPLRAVVLTMAREPSRLIVRAARAQPRFLSCIVEALTRRGFDVLESEAHARGADFVRDAVDRLGCTAVLSFGGDESAQQLRAQLHPEVLHEARGHGAAVTVIAPSARAAVALDSYARAVADDLCAYDGFGCLSSRLVFVVDHAADDGLAESFARALCGALETPRWPRAPLHAAHLAAVLQWQGRAAACSEWLVRGRGFSVVFAREGPWQYPPGGRCVWVHQLGDDSEVRRALGPYAHSLTQIGVVDPSHDAVARWIDGPCWARLARVGTLQDPPLDGYEDPRPPLTLDRA